MLFAIILGVIAWVLIMAVGLSLCKAADLADREAGYK